MCSDLDLDNIPGISDCGWFTILLFDRFLQRHVHFILNLYKKQNPNQVKIGTHIFSKAAVSTMGQAIQITWISINSTNKITQSEELAHYKCRYSQHLVLTYYIFSQNIFFHICSVASFQYGVQSVHVYI